MRLRLALECDRDVNVLCEKEQGDGAGKSSENRVRVEDFPRY